MWCLHCLYFIIKNIHHCQVIKQESNRYRMDVGIGTGMNGRQITTCFHFHSSIHFCFHWFPAFLLAHASIHYDLPPRLLQSIPGPFPVPFSVLLFLLSTLKFPSITRVQRSFVKNSSQVKSERKLDNSANYYCLHQWIMICLYSIFGKYISWAYIPTDSQMFIA